MNYANRATGIALAVFVTAIPYFSTLAAPSQPSLDEAVQRAVAAFGAPGAVLSVVRDGEIVYASGSGVAETGSAMPVDERTLFRIGSVSKAFTAAALALLVDEGRLDWDDPVIDYLPEFRMQDPWVTREFSIRDLLTHRSGLPLGAGDLLMFPDSNATRADVIRALRFLKPSTSFRSEYAYDNLLYIVAGEVVARASGMAYEEFLESRLFEPLGMTDCIATAERAAADAPVATPHVRIDGELQTTTTRMTSLVAAAGGIVCSARSMAKWMLFLLDEGIASEGRRLISEEQFAELVRPVTLVPVSQYLKEHAGASINTYALGWGVSTFYGNPVWSHGGAVWGMTAYIIVLPEQKLAAFASNNLMSAAPRALAYQAIDLFLRDSNAAAGKDWIGILADLVAERQSAADDAVEQAFAERNADSMPSLPLEKYTGLYRDPWYGDVRITLEDGALRFQSERNAPLEGPLEHFQYDTFVARWTDRRLMADAYVSFTLNPEGAVERIRMKAVSPATDFSYDFHDLDLRPVPPP
ncbi:MAG: serine hydrolase [Woeseiaceae bacterium]|nr:serine hydrolase [Woeseiaceae bacterium]